MPIAFDTPVTPFTGPFAALPTEFLEASTRAINASAELYTQVLTSQAEATRTFLEAYAGLGGQAVRTAAETAERATERAEETTTRGARTTARAARTTGRAAQRAPRRAARATRKAAKPALAAVKAEAPITGYDDLTADQLVAKLPEQPQATLALVAAYEQANEKRATVLQRVAALSGPEPAPGYDEMNADDAQTLVTNGSSTLATTVRDYERRHKNRASVLEAAARRADADAS